MLIRWRWNLPVKPILASLYVAAAACAPTVYANPSISFEIKVLPEAENSFLKASQAFAEANGFKYKEAHNDRREPLEVNFHIQASGFQVVGLNNADITDFEVSFYDHKFDNEPSFVELDAYADAYEAAVEAVAGVTVVKRADGPEASMEQSR